MRRDGLPQRYVEISELSDKELNSRYAICKSHLSGLKRLAKKKPITYLQKTVINWLERLEIPEIEAELEVRSNPMYKVG